MATAKSPQVNPVEQLNVFLHDELSAVETYKIALDNLEAHSHARSNLEACLQSHQARAALLRAAVGKLGGEPAHHGVAWEALVRVVEGLADDIGDKAAVAALEECEAHELDDYRQRLPRLDASTRQLVELQILPRQLQTQHAISELKKTLH